MEVSTCCREGCLTRFLIRNALCVLENNLNKGRGKSDELPLLWTNRELEISMLNTLCKTLLTLSGSTETEVVQGGIKGWNNERDQRVPKGRPRALAASLNSQLAKLQLTATKTAQEPATESKRNLCRRPASKGFILQVNERSIRIIELIGAEA